MKNGLVKLGPEEIPQQIEKTTVSLPIDSIRRVRVKRTVAGTIREILFLATAGEKMNINGVKEFELFLRDLSCRTPCDTVISGFSEKIDYDHRLFMSFSVWRPEVPPPYSYVFCQHWAAKHLS